ncbi:MAG: hypothetical protein ACXWXP_06095 [Actinomycetota bacterium]
MNELAALVGFAFAASASPGPNHTVLWASGLSFRFHRTSRTWWVTALGITMLVVGVALLTTTLAVALVASVALLWV